MVSPIIKQHFSLEVYNANNQELLNGVNTNAQNIQTNAENINALAIFKADITKMFYPDNQYGGIVAEDLNILAVSGFYTCYGTATGSPFTDSSAFVLHFNSNVGTVSAYQKAVAYTDGRVLYRFKRASTWTSWGELPSISATLGTLTNVSSTTQRYAKKKNGSVQYVIAGTATFTSGASYQIETLPTGFTPPVDQIYGLQIGNSALCNGVLTITTAGVITFKALTTISAKTININVSFQL